MRKRIIYHLLPEGKGWKITKQGSKETIKKFSSKEAGLSHGRRLAQGENLGQLKVHLRDGKLQTEYTYGKDPRRYES